MNIDDFTIEDDGSRNGITTHEREMMNVTFPSVAFSLALKDLYRSCPEGQRFVQEFPEAPGVFYNSMRLLLDSQIGKQICDGGVRPKIVMEILNAATPLALSVSRIEAVANQVTKFAEDKFGKRLGHGDTYSVLGKVKGLVNNSRLSSWFLEIISQAALMSTDNLPAAELAMAEFATVQVLERHNVTDNDMSLFRSLTKVQTIPGCNDLIVTSKDGTLDFNFEKEHVMGGYIVKLEAVTFGITDESIRTGVFSGISDVSPFGQHLLHDIVLQLEPKFVKAFAAAKRTELTVNQPTFVKVVCESSLVYKEAVEKGYSGGLSEVEETTRVLQTKLLFSEFGPNSDSQSMLRVLGLGSNFFTLLDSGAPQETVTAVGIMDLATRNLVFADNLRLLKEFRQSSINMTNHVLALTKSSMLQNLCANLVNEYLRYQRVLDPRIREDVGNQLGRQLPNSALPWFVEEVFGRKTFKTVLTNSLELVEHFDILTNVRATKLGISIIESQEQIALYSITHDVRQVPADPSYWNGDTLASVDKCPGTTLVLIDLINGGIVTKNEHQIGFSNKTWVAPFFRAKRLSTVLGPLTAAGAGCIMVRFPNWHSTQDWLDLMSTKVKGYAIKFAPPRAWHEGYSFVVLTKDDVGVPESSGMFLIPFFRNMTVASTMFLKGVVERNYYQRMANMVDIAQVEELRRESLDFVQESPGIELPSFILKQAMKETQVFNVVTKARNNRNAMGKKTVSSCLNSFKAVNLAKPRDGLDSLDSFYADMDTDPSKVS